MWKDKLRKVQETGNKYLLTCVNPGAPNEIINIWSIHIQSALGIKPPQEFIDILLCANGFEWNGFILYGVDQDFLDNPSYAVSGLIEQNKIWYEVESQRDYLFLGESNISWYVYEITSGRYMELDNPSGREIMIFNSCAEMLEKLLDDCLS